MNQSNVIFQRFIYFESHGFAHLKTSDAQILLDFFQIQTISKPHRIRLLYRAVFQLKRPPLNEIFIGRSVLVKICIRVFFICD